MPPCGPSRAPESFDLRVSLDRRLPEVAERGRNANGEAQDQRLPGWQPRLVENEAENGHCDRCEGDSEQEPLDSLAGGDPRGELPPSQESAADVGGGIAAERAKQHRDHERDPMRQLAKHDAVSEASPDPDCAEDAGGGHACALPVGSARRGEEHECAARDQGRDERGPALRNSNERQRSSGGAGNDHDRSRRRHEAHTLGCGEPRRDGKEGRERPPAQQRRDDRNSQRGHRDRDPRRQVAEALSPFAGAPALLHDADAIGTAGSEASA